jgi:hypothetical protein
MVRGPYGTGMAGKDGGELQGVPSTVDELDLEAPQIRRFVLQPTVGEGRFSLSGCAMNDDDRLVPESRGDSIQPAASRNVASGQDVLVASRHALLKLV